MKTIRFLPLLVAITAVTSPIAFAHSPTFVPAPAQRKIASELFREKAAVAASATDVTISMIAVHLPVQFGGPDDVIRKSLRTSSRLSLLDK